MPFTFRGPAVGRVRRRAAPALALVVAASILGLTPGSATALTCTSGSGIECSPFNVGWGFNDRVRTMVRAGDVIYLGGRFTLAERVDPDTGTILETAERDHLAAVDATTGALLPWAPRIDAGYEENGDVYQLVTYTDPATSATSVFAAGDFVSVETTSDGATYAPSTRQHLAAFATDRYGSLTPWAGSVGRRARALAISGKKVYVGGSFSWAQGSDQSTRDKTYRGLAAFGARRGHLKAWKPKATGGVGALGLAPDGNVVAAGAFTALTSMDGTKTTGAYLGVVAPAGGLLSFSDPPTGKVLGLDVEAGSACTAPSGACIFTGEGGSANSAEAFSETGTRLWSRETNGDVQAVAFAAGRLIIGGHFGKVLDTDGLGTVKIKKAAALYPGFVSGSCSRCNGHLDFTWKPNLQPADSLGVWGVTATPHVLYLGGDFTKSRSQQTWRFAQYHLDPV